MANVCNSQSEFNTAFKTAVDEYNKSNRPSTAVMLLTAIIMILFIVWAVMLASKVQDKDHKILHTVLAIAFGPIYVLGYYLSGAEN